MDLLQVTHISKTYGSGETAVHALKDVSFTVPKGEFAAIVGESGSGKSTLLNMIGALDTPTSGKVLINGNDVFAMNEKSLLRHVQAGDRSFSLLHLDTAFKVGGNDCAVRPGGGGGLGVRSL